MSGISIRSTVLEDAAQWEKIPTKKDEKAAFWSMHQRLIEELKGDSRKASAEAFKGFVTVSLGVVIPALSLMCSAFVGNLWHSTPALAAAFGVIGLIVMIVSVGHLQWAIRDITDSQAGPAWMLAICIDAAVVCCELANVLGHGGWLAWLGMITATIFSMVLNVYAFKNHTTN